MKHNVSLSLLLLTMLFAAVSAQAQTVNPTPIAISLTPDATEPPTVTPTPDSPFGADRFEPNDSAETATSLSFQTERDLTLVANDVDYFTVFTKAGQIVQADTRPIDGLDTRLKLFWNGQLVAENDDRTPSELGSSALFTASADGWLVALIEKVTAQDGRYDLTLSLTIPTSTPTSSPTPTSTATSTPSPTATATPQATHTPQPTAMPMPSATPTAIVWPTATVEPTSIPPTIAWPTATATWVAPTATQIVWPTVTPTPSIATPPPPIFQPTTPIRVLDTADSSNMVEATLTTIISTTPTLTSSNRLTDTTRLTVQHIGRITPAATTVTTQIQLLIYYDSNNDRIPSPSEGVANISVLAVDTRGQRLAQVFTNSQGEASFALTDSSIARIVVPFVPGWSERVRVGDSNSGIVLGLPAVRLPIFFPVAPMEESS